VNGAPPTPEQEAASRRSARNAALIVTLALTLGCAFFGLVAWAVVLPALRALERQGERAPGGE
jgi:hypothetical protein